MKRYILALDEGTTSARAVVYDTHEHKICAVSSKPLTLYYPRSGWVEQDAEEIWRHQLFTLKKAISKCGITPEEIICISLTNQRETVVVWDKKTGRPIYNAVVWQCRRTSEEMEKLRADKAAADQIRQKTGLVCDAYFSASKIKWMLDNIAGARKRAENGELLAGTIDSWLVYNLTGGASHVTDVTNASRTMLYDINKLSWDTDLCKLFGIPFSMLPTVIHSDAPAGVCKLLGGAIPVRGILGDQQAALFGQACFKKGEAKNTYGTGCFMLLNVGEKPTLTKNNLITTPAWTIGGKTVYALEGSIFNAGSSVQWLRDNLKFFKKAPDSEALAASVADTGGVYVVPAFTGLGAPYWDAEARGIITGITRATTAAHITRATLEAMAYATRDVTDVMAADSGTKLTRLSVDGGAANNNFLMQFQADILGVKICRPEVTESTVLGAVYAGAVGEGVLDAAKIQKMRRIEREFAPVLLRAEAQEKYNGWKKAVEKCRGC